jgi:hypothetical protein
MTTVFGLSESDLVPIVENVAGERVASFDVTLVPHEWKRYGIRGEKLVALVRYGAASGRAGEAKVFVKKQCDPVMVNGTPIEPRPVESHHYFHLSACGAPIPRFYGALTIHDPLPREVLFLEYIDDIVVEDEPWPQFQSDPARFDAYLQALAHFNSIRPPTEYARLLPKPHSHFVHQMADAPAKVDRVWSYAKESKLGPSLRATCSERNRQRMDKFWEKVGRSIAQMPMGLSAGDHEPHQSGRRRDGEAVLFDFEFAGYAPRFYDVAVTLGAPDDYCPRCGSAEELAEVYLEEYRRRGGAHVSTREFLAETRELWIAWAVGWIDYAYEPASGEHPCSAELLQRKLESLLQHAG